VAQVSIMRGIKVVFFDAAGTLLHLPRSVGFHYAEVAARHGWNADAGSLQCAFVEAWRVAPPPAASRGPRADDDRGWWRALVAEVMAKCGAPPGLDGTALFADLYAEFTRPGVWELYLEVPEVLAALAKRYRLGVLSNFDGRLRRILAQLGILNCFEHLVISSEVGADKPHPWIFEAALACAGIAPHEALLVGDDAACDVEGARLAGWHAFHVERPAITLRDLLPALNAGPCGS